MKVLFDHPDPFLFAHGGVQNQIEQTKGALETLGVEVDFLRWWDDRQKPEIIHYFGRAHSNYVRLAHRKGIKVVMSALLSSVGARSSLSHAVQRAANGILGSVLPNMWVDRFGWASFRIADRCTALTAWEGKLMREIFGTPAEKIRVVPNGVEQVFMDSPMATRGPWLICTATLTECKRVVELAHAAARARTPVWVLGKPYADDDPYAREFMAAAAANREFVRYEGPVNDRRKLAAIYREARGFVLLSTHESLSLSALEAAACECPLLLSDLPWAHTVFQDRAMFCPVVKDVETTASALRAFYDAAPTLKPPPKPATWLDVGRQLKDVYAELLKPA
jgi:glycosyltransferase involved in cell wall biosynthesis